jgi:hypothetical protein
MEFKVDAIDPVQIDYGNGRVYPAIFDMRAMAYVEEKTGKGHLTLAKQLIDEEGGYSLKELAALGASMHRSAGVDVTDEQVLQAINFQNYNTVGMQIIAAMIGGIPQSGEDDGGKKNVKK